MADNELEALLLGLGKPQDQDGYLTVAELSQKTGRDAKWIRAKLTLLKTAGRLAVGRKTGESLSGSRVTVAAYRITPVAPARTPATKKR